MILRSKPQFDNHDTIYQWFVTSNSNWQFYSHHSHVCFPDINEGGYLIGNVTIKSMTNEIPGKKPKNTFLQTMLQSTTDSEIRRDLSLFGYSSLVKSSFSWYSSTMNFKELKFHDKLKFQKSERSLHISKTVINC